MKLVIVESPNKVRAIQRYLELAAPGPWRVVATVGHWRGLQRMDGQRFEEVVDVERGWNERFELHKPDVAQRLASAVKGVREIFLATDPDREGEAIAWHVADYFKLPSPKRLLINEVTKAGVQKALRSATTLDRKLVDAQRARALLDYWIGMEVSRLLWPFGAKSAGRVQSCALRLVVEREQAIATFVPTTYWTVGADYREGFTAQVATLEAPKDDELDDADHHDATPRLRPKRFLDRAEAEAVVAEGKRVRHVVDAVESKPVTRRPPPPFTTASLLAAATGIGMKPNTVSTVAQRLFERGLVTYIRTDSVALSDEGIADIRDYLGVHHGALLPREPQRYSSGAHSEGAHEAIRPTAMANPDASRLEGDDKRLYDLIWRRTLICQMESAKLERTTVTIRPDGCKWRLLGVGSVILASGFLAFAGPTGEKELELPQLAVGQALNLRDMKLTESKTKPPPRFTTRSLIRYLERRGIGRPSTYAGVVATLFGRGYVREEKRQLMPEELGVLAERLVRLGFDKLSQEGFTALTERSLDDIAEGKVARPEFLTAFYKENVGTLASARARLASEPRPPRSNAYKSERTTKSSARSPSKPGARKRSGAKAPAPSCSGCGATMVMRRSAHGEFWGCSGYPNCRQTRPTGAAPSSR